MFTYRKNLYRFYNLRRRFKEYFNVNHLLRNKHLAICAALAKYGYSQFSVEILEYCDPSDILKREQYYLDLLKPQYNILKIAGSFAGDLNILLKPPSGAEGGRLKIN